MKFPFSHSSNHLQIFAGNTNNAGVKFHLVVNPISTRHVQFMKNSNLLHDYTLRVEIYGRPQGTVLQRFYSHILFFKRFTEKEIW